MLTRMRNLDHSYIAGGIEYGATIANKSQPDGLQSNGHRVGHNLATQAAATGAESTYLRAKTNKT